MSDADSRRSYGNYRNIPIYHHPWKHQLRIAMCVSKTLLTFKFLFYIYINALTLYEQHDNEQARDSQSFLWPPNSPENKIIKHTLVYHSPFCLSLSTYGFDVVRLRCASTVPSRCFFGRWKPHKHTPSIVI